MTEKKNIRLLLADDHKYLLDGVKLSLDISGFDIVAHTTDVHQVLPLYQEHRPDVVLLDIMFNQEKTGLDALAELLGNDQAAKVVIFSQYDQDEMVQKAYASGAKAFLTKAARIDTLVEAIEKAHAGEVYFTNDIAQRIASLATRKSLHGHRSPKELLTPKELEIFCLLARGLTELETAKSLGCHQRTITANKATIKEKLGISRPAEFTMAALRDELISLDTPLNQNNK